MSSEFVRLWKTRAAAFGTVRPRLFRTVPPGRNRSGDVDGTRRTRRSPLLWGGASLRGPGHGASGRRSKVNAPRRGWRVGFRGGYGCAATPGGAGVFHIAPCGGPPPAASGRSRRPGAESGRGPPTRTPDGDPAPRGTTPGVTGVLSADPSVGRAWTQRRGRLDQSLPARGGPLRMVRVECLTVSGISAETPCPPQNRTLKPQSASCRMEQVILSQSSGAPSRTFIPVCVRICCCLA
ncbi:hypothetical protein ABH917_003731 [Thermobifida halotolerans]